MLYQLQSVLQKRTFRYYNFFNCAKHSILPDKTSPARKRARRTYSQNSIAQKSKIIVSKGSFFIQSLNKLTPEFSPTHFILRKSYIKGKENKNKVVKRPLKNGSDKKGDTDGKNDDTFDEVE